MLRTLFIARFETRNFVFEGVGLSAPQATDVLKQGLRAHARQYGLRPDWFEEPGWDDSDLFNVREFTVGTAYRDREEI